MTIQELITKFNAEQVGGRLIAVVNGKKEYIADLLDSGYALTYHGQMLVETAAEEAAAKPKRRGKKDDELSDLLNGVEE